MDAPVAVLVENYQPISDVLRALLEESGYQVQHYRTSLAGSAAIGATRPALVVTNTWLETREAGWQLLAQLAADPQTSTLPVVICSADLPRLRERAARLQQPRWRVVGYPFEIVDLITLLEEARPTATQAGSNA